MESLNPRVRLVWLAGVAVVAAVVAAAIVAVDRFLVTVDAWVVAVAVVLVGLVGIGYVLTRYRIWRFEIRDDSIYLERGVFTRVRTVVPFVRIQHVDTRRSPVERAVGLASTVIYTAGSRGADVTIPGLAPARADDLQERLKGLSAAAESDDAV